MIRIMKTKIISGIMAAMMLLGTTNMSASSKPNKDRMSNQPCQEVRIDNRNTPNGPVNNDCREDDRTYRMQPRKTEAPKPVPRNSKSSNDAAKITTGVVIGTVLGAVISSITK
jgi:hypothetical protein